MDWPAHSWNVCRRNLGQLQRQCTQCCGPLASLTGRSPCTAGSRPRSHSGHVACQGSDQTGNQYLPGAWQGIEDGKIGVGLGELLNPSIVFPNRFVEGGERVHRGTRGRTAGGDHGEVGGGPPRPSAWLPGAFDSWFRACTGAPGKTCAGWLVWLSAVPPAWASAPKNPAPRGCTDPRTTAATADNTT